MHDAVASEARRPRAPWHTRLGLGSEPADTRLAWNFVLVVLLVYALAFACFYPTAETNVDEAIYIRQARLVLEARASLDLLDAETGQITQYYPSLYPVGTAVLMAPFVGMFGWRGAFLVPLFGLIAGILITALWIREHRRSPLFALLILGFPSVLVLGRVGMSDVPSMAVVAFGLWLFWRGQDRGWPWWLGSGFVAGASMILREPNCLPFAPFFAGAVLRRETRCWALVVGGLAGVSLRLLASWLAFDQPFFFKAPYVIATDTILDRLPLYLVGLLVFLPGGLAIPFAYRGPRRPEVLISIWLFVAFYLSQAFDMTSSTLQSRLVLTLRYVIPILPVVAFAMADALPRLWRRSLESCSPSIRHRATRIASAGIAVWLVGLGMLSVGVNLAFDRWSVSRSRIRDVIREHVGDDSVVVTNWSATRKFIDPLYRRFLPVILEETPVEQVNALVERHGEYFVVVLDRSDSDFWRQSAQDSAQFLEALRPLPVLEVDLQVTAEDRLRIWRVRAAPSEG